MVVNNKRIMIVLWSILSISGTIMFQSCMNYENDSQALAIKFLGEEEENSKKKKAYVIDFVNDEKMSSVVPSVVDRLKKDYNVYKIFDTNKENNPMQFAKVFSEECKNNRIFLDNTPFILISDSHNCDSAKRLLEYDTFKNLFPVGDNDKSNVYWLNLFGELNEPIKSTGEMFFDVFDKLSDGVSNMAIDSMRNRETYETGEKFAVGILLAHKIGRIFIGNKLYEKEEEKREFIKFECPDFLNLFCISTSDYDKNHVIVEDYPNIIVDNFEQLPIAINYFFEYFIKSMQSNSINKKAIKDIENSENEIVERDINWFLDRVNKKK